MKVMFRGEECRVVVTKYAKPHNIALILVDKTGAPFAKASVNPDYFLGEGMVAVKSYSENQGILEALVSAGIVAKTGDTIPMNYAEFHLCRLLISEGE